jgi:hypothetical protein
MRLVTRAFILHKKVTSPRIRTRIAAPRRLDKARSLQNAERTGNTVARLSPRRGRTARACACALGAAAVWALRCGVAGADDHSASAANEQRAANAYDKATERFRKGDYPGAADWFELANQLAPTSQALQGAIRAHRQAGSAAHVARAATLALELRARYAADAASARLAGDVLESVAPVLVRLRVSCGACVLQVDGAESTGLDLFVAPGEHQLLARWPTGQTSSQSILRSAGASETIEWSEPAAAPAMVPPLTSPARPSAPVRPDQDPRSPRPGLGLPPSVALVGAGLTAALGIATAVNWWLVAVPDGNKLIQEARTTHQPDPGLQSSTDTADARATALLVTTGGIGLATAVIALFFTRWRHAELVLAPRASSAGAGMSVGAAF